MLCMRSGQELIETNMTNLRTLLTATSRYMCRSRLRCEACVFKLARMGNGPPLRPWYFKNTHPRVELQKAVKIRPCFISAKQMELGSLAKFSEVDMSLRPPKRRA